MRHLPDRISKRSIRTLTPLLVSSGTRWRGRLSAVGEGVGAFSIGDRVMVFHHIPCGRCYYCRKKTYAQCETYARVGATAGFEPSGGGFAEYIRVMDWIVAGGGVVRIPDGVPFEQAAFVEPVTTCLKAVKLLDLQPDETVLVIGQGPIGILLASLALRSGAKILTSDVSAERHDVAKSLGLIHPIDAKNEDVVARVKAESEGARSGRRNSRGRRRCFDSDGHGRGASWRQGHALRSNATRGSRDRSWSHMLRRENLLGSYSSSVDFQPKQQTSYLRGTAPVTI